VLATHRRRQTQQADCRGNERQHQTVQNHRQQLMTNSTSTTSPGLTRYAISKGIIEARSPARQSRQRKARPGVLSDPGSISGRLSLPWVPSSVALWRRCLLLYNTIVPNARALPAANALPLAIVVAPNTVVAVDNAGRRGDAASVHNAAGARTVPAASVLPKPTAWLRKRPWLPATLVVGRPP